MNPPLWAMLIAVVIASIPRLQQLFFEEGSFIANSVTRAIGQSGGVAVPLILVVLGANLARNTLPKEAHDENSEENQIGTKLLVASLISRMLLPTIVMAPMLALAAKYVPVSILDDPIFVIVCFLLTGAPSALQLAQICQINGVYEGVMSKLLFQSYVIWYVFAVSQIYLLLTPILGFFLQRSFWLCARSRLSNGQTPSNFLWKSVTLLNLYSYCIDMSELYKERMVTGASQRHKYSMASFKETFPGTVSWEIMYSKIDIPFVLTWQFSTCFGICG
jgi:hypothetical protein